MSTIHNVYQCGRHFGVVNSIIAAVLEFSIPKRFCLHNPIYGL